MGRLMGPLRHWGAPPPVSSRHARAAYFDDWRWQLLPRRGEAQPGGMRRYEVRVAMTGIVYTVNDDLSTVADVDLRDLLARAEAGRAATLARPERFFMESEHVRWLHTAAVELIRRTGGVAPGSTIGREDWHMRDLERLRRVAARAALTLLPSMLDETTREAR